MGGLLDKLMIRLYHIAATKQLPQGGRAALFTEHNSLKFTLRGNEFSKFVPPGRI